MSVKRKSETASVKRSVTIRRDVNEAVLARVGEGEYSAFVNDALVMAIQARGIEESIREYEAEFGASTPEDIARAHRLLDEGYEASRDAVKATA